MHLKSKHTLFQCISLHKSLNAPLPDQDDKGKDEEEGDKSGAQGYQDRKNVINVIFGCDGGFPTKRRSLFYMRSYLSSLPYNSP
jgi:hypothetical protein